MKINLITPPEEVMCEAQRDAKKKTPQPEAMAASAEFREKEKNLQTVQLAASLHVISLSGNEQLIPSKVVIKWISRIMCTCIVRVVSRKTINHHNQSVTTQNKSQSIRLLSLIAFLQSGE